ncbi:MAG: hypothetical protein GY743_14050, partial [Planctomycetaceae bacterium]|nr:hypothetical protein [Planctomycetaceae bacterium]
YGTRYAINPAGDLVVHNPWATGENNYMFITSWKDQDGDVKAAHDAGGYSSGPGDIALSKFSFRSSTLNDLIKGVNPPATEGQEDILGGWALFRFKARILTGSNLFPENSDPLILDLDGDGFGLEWRNGYSPDFDIDLDLFAENTATLDRDDGFLARDINGDGLINDASELFGHGNVAGFAVLGALDGNGDVGVHCLDNALADVNGDGVLAGSDRFDSLLIWRDINGEMVSQAKALGSGADHDVVSLPLPENGGFVAAAGD